MTDETQAGAHGNPSVRHRMEALGWALNVCEDTCAVTWCKMAPGARAVGAYHPGDGSLEWERDLARCQEDFGYHEGATAY